MVERHLYLSVIDIYRHMLTKCLFFFLCYDLSAKIVFSIWIIVTVLLSFSSGWKDLKLRLFLNFAAELSQWFYTFTHNYR